MASPTVGTGSNPSPSWQVQSNQVPFWVRRCGAWATEMSLVIASGLVPFTIGSLCNRSPEPVPLNPVVKTTGETVAATLGIPVRDRSPRVAPLTNLFWSAALLAPLAVGGWQLYLLAKKGQTLPKGWFGVQVIDLNGSAPGWQRVLRREALGRWGIPLTVAYTLWQVTGAYPNLLILTGLSGLLGLADGLIGKRFQGRTGHDLLGGTTVREVPSPIFGNPFTSYDWTPEEEAVRAIVLTPEHSKEPLNLWAWMRQHPGLTLIIVSSASMAAVLGTFVGTQVYIQKQANFREFQHQDNEVFLALVTKLSPNATRDANQRRAAILALGAIKDTRAIPLLVDLLGQEQNPGMLEVIQQALVSTGPQSLPYLRRLNQALKNDLESMQFGANSQAKQIVARRQQATQRAIAKILKVYGGFIHDVDLSRIDLGQNTAPPAPFTLVLDQTDLSGIVFRSSILTHASLRNSRFHSAGEDGRLGTFDDWISDLSGADLTDANLTGAVLSNTAMKRTNLLRAILNQANLSKADLTGINLSSAKLLGANLQGAMLKEARLTGADLVSANLSNANLEAARLTEVKAQGAQFINTNLNQGDLKKADLSAVDFKDANLKDADFTGAKLTGSNFKNAKLEDAKFQKADLSLVNFQGAKIDGTDFKGANFVFNQKQTPDQFIESPDFSSPSSRMKGVDFTTALNLDSNQITYLCSQGAIHPNCPKEEKKE